MIAFHAVNAYEFSGDSVRQVLNGSHKAGNEDRKMTTYAKNVEQLRISAMVLLIAGLLILSGNVFASETEGDRRISVTMENSRVQRDNGVAGKTSQNEFAVLRIAGERDKSTWSSAQSKAAVQAAQSPNVSFWFYTADIVLFNDHDSDGYYHGIDLLFDADTYYAFAEVYAVVYLSLDGGPWNEYAATDNFTILGATSDDEYVLVTELLSGYPSGSYDVLIELFDAFDDSFLAYFGPDDTSELAFLPLEDADRDVAVVPEVIVVNRGGGGSLGWFFILALGLTALRRNYL